MARPIWTGTLSFGLLNIPVRLMSGERRAARLRSDPWEGFASARQILPGS